jgi:hypothetical protein
LNFTSGKSGIWPLAARGNQGFVNIQNFPRGKDLGTKFFYIYSIWRRKDTAKYAGKMISLDCYEQCVRV